MLVTNQWLNKLAASRVDFVNQGMVLPTYSCPTQPKDLDNPDGDKGPIDDAHVTGHVLLARTHGMWSSDYLTSDHLLISFIACNYPQRLEDLAHHINLPSLTELSCQFLYNQLHAGGNLTSNNIDLDDCPKIHSKISVFHLAVATFYAPSDESGICGMWQEQIRATPLWQGRGLHHDCAFAVEDQDKPGVKGMCVIWLKMFFSFEHQGQTYPCALVEWFKVYGRSPNVVTRMWRVCPETVCGNRLVMVLHLDTFLRGAH
jgi:hypothetical protein